MPVPLEPAHGVDALYAPRRTLIDPILGHAAAEAGAAVRVGLRVTGLIRSASGRVTGVTGIDAGGSAIGIRARFVVGADGLHSTIARLVGAPVEHRGEYASATTYGYWTGAQVDGYEWIFRPDAAAGIIPTNGGQVCVFANATPQRIGRGGVDVIQSILRSSAPDLAKRLDEARAPSGTRLFRAPPGFLRRAWGNGWALVGDAGYFKDPLSAHGMTDALRDAELLARALMAAHEGADETGALAEYQAMRDTLSLPLSAAMQKEVSLIAGLDQDAEPRAAALRAA